MAEDLPGARLAAWRAALPGVVVNPVSSAWFHPALATQTLLGHFQVAGLEMFGLARAGRDLAAGAAGALLRYVTSLALRRPEQVTSLRFSERGDRLLLDEETLRNLEVFRTLRGERGPGTLIHHVDATVTPAGRRLLERRLAEPLTDLALLGEWHAGVAGAVTDRDVAAAAARHPARHGGPRALGGARRRRPLRPGAAAPARPLAARRGRARRRGRRRRPRGPPRRPPRRGAAARSTTWPAACSTR